MTGSIQHGTVHGRFQPFHLGHLHYLRLALERCEELTIGITNPDRFARAGDSAEAHRHTPESNPFSFWERARMIRNTLLDAGVPPERFSLVPLDINHLETTDLAAYMPGGATWMVRTKGEWGRQKLARLRELGLALLALPFEEWTELTATEVRDALREGGDWESLVPAGTARVLREIGAAERLRSG